MDTELREKVWAQLNRVYQAQEARDDVKLDKAVKGMCKAYTAMEDWATANGVSEIPDVRQIEHQQELILVVEWQHLERHRSCRGHPGGGQSQPGHKNQKTDRSKSSLQHRHHDGAKESVQKRLFDEFRIVDIVD